LVRNGDIVSARLVLERAARAGHAQAALELGLSFDPEFLRQLRVIGLTPEVALARQWYERASSLGSSEAKLHLNRLTQTQSK
jgi:TPR repeat protein